MKRKLFSEGCLASESSFSVSCQPQVKDWHLGDGPRNISLFE
ncbi:hypothetical protein QY95_00765 [Bacillus thermotolerans]|uniref:Uncharacterized protein n=1 Tax=Bacillus thermotolerans TaxID=1221996 RepID=A0A0F5I7D2_BACTR|nr:hypothetical protein QY95_00765 [Bacillus thermotolerans]